MKIKYIDTHAHLNISAFNDDVNAVAKQCAEDGVVVFNVGTKESTSQKGVELSVEHDNCYAIIGLHPIQTVAGRHEVEETGEGAKPFKSKGEEFDKDFYRELAKNRKVIGIGECGFDYWHCPPETYETQERNFIAQIELANELNLPLMIHTRGPKPGEASPTGRSVYADVYDTLNQYTKVPFNVHFYAGTLPEAEKFFELGGTISFTGVITFAKDYEPVVKAVPIEKIHGETDCPYVAPVPHRGKRAEPWMVIEVYKKIAAIRGEDEECVRKQLLENALRHYSISV
jgi:TatD DNase family protein